MIGWDPWIKKGDKYLSCIENEKWVWKTLTVVHKIPHAICWSIIEYLLSGWFIINIRCTVRAITIGNIKFSCSLFQCFFGYFCIYYIHTSFLYCYILSSLLFRHELHCTFSLSIIMKRSPYLVFLYFLVFWFCLDKF